MCVKAEPPLTRVWTQASYLTSFSKSKFRPSSYQAAAALTSAQSWGLPAAGYRDVPSLCLRVFFPGRPYDHLSITNWRSKSNARQRCPGVSDFETQDLRELVSRSVGFSFLICKITHLGPEKCMKLLSFQRFLRLLFIGNWFCTYTFCSVAYQNILFYVITNSLGEHLACYSIITNLMH